MANILGMMKQAQEMQKKMQALQAEMETAVFQGSAAGGAVTVTMTGKYECQGVSIDPELVDPEDVETLEDSVRAAINDAVGKASTTLKQKMDAATGGMKLPGMGG